MFEQAIAILEAHGNDALKVLNQKLPPNVPQTVTDQELFWNVIATSSDGEWKFEQNIVGKNYRLLSSGKRVAWGPNTVFHKAVSFMIDYFENSNGAIDTGRNRTMSSDEAMDKLNKIKELYDRGILSESEFEMKKSELMPYI